MSASDIFLIFLIFSSVGPIAFVNREKIHSFVKGYLKTQMPSLDKQNENIQKVKNEDDKIRMQQVKEIAEIIKNNDDHRNKEQPLGRVENYDYPPRDPNLNNNVDHNNYNNYNNGYRNSNKNYSDSANNVSNKGHSLIDRISTFITDTVRAIWSIITTIIDFAISIFLKFLPWIVGVTISYAIGMWALKKFASGAHGSICQGIIKNFSEISFIQNHEKIREYSLKFLKCISFFDDQNDGAESATGESTTNII